MPTDPPVGRLGRRHPRRGAVPLPPEPALPAAHLDQMTALTSAGRVVVMVEDPTMRSTIAFYLIRAGYEVLAGVSSFELVSDLAVRPPSLILVHAGRDHRTELAPLTTLRSNEALRGVSIVVLDDAEDRRRRAAAFAAGATDYLVWTFEPEEVVLRLAALLRRATPRPSSGSLQLIGPIHIDRARHEVTVHGHPIALTTTEFKLLSILAARPGVLHSRHDLLAELGQDSAETTRAVDMHMYRLRGKLGRARHLVETIRGFGYRIGSPGFR